MQTNSSKNIFTEWLSWQFYEMPRFLFGVWKNYILFTANYFSILILLKSLFAPWRKYRWNYPKWFQVGEFLSTLISNAFSRLLGALVRIVLIVAGILFQISVIFIGLLVLLLWVLIPFIIIGGLIFVYVI